MQTRPILLNQKKLAGKKSKHQTRGPNLYLIFEDICKIFEQDPSAVIHGGRIEDHVKCKRMFCRVANEITNANLVAIGDVFGKDHSVVIHHLRTVNNLVDSKDEKYQKDWAKYSTESKIWQQYGK